MDRMVRISRDLARDADALSFGPPVAYVYNPLDYARTPHEQYLKRFGKGPKEAVFVGMNPGPFGMAQTGVPFGDVGLVREWMGIDGKVGKPDREHPKRPIEGFDCARSEVSGSRLWGWARERFGPPERFFDRFFVHNYCPLAFLEEGGKNRTPDKLRAAEREPLLEACDRALLRVLDALSPGCVIGIGAWADKRARETIGDGGPSFGRILHPSPASPKANQGWAPAAERELAEMGIAIG